MTKDLELEMLIALATQGSDDGRELNEAQRFVLAKGIKEGEAHILPTHVWLTYLDWMNNEPEITMRQFCMQFSKLFKQRRHGQKRFYKLDPSAFDMSIDCYWKVRAAIRKERAKRKRNVPKEEDETY